MKDEKYLVYKNNLGFPGELVEDAVVIRRQDIFAPPALDAYASAILCVIEAVKGVDANMTVVKRLEDIADYFRRQAEEAWNTRRKMPD